MHSAILIGFGNVGRHVAEELKELSGEVAVSGALSSRGGLAIKGEEGFEKLLRLAREGGKLDKHPSFIEGLTLKELISEASPDIAFITLPPNYRGGEPNRSLYYTLVREDVSIITADKTVLALEYRDFMRYASSKGVFVGFRATVAAGTPMTDVANGLRGREVEGVRGVLNSTTNYILSLMEGGLTYEDALRRAIEEELAEPDPSIDVDGWDAAAKLTILLNVLGVEASLNDVERVSLSEAAETRRVGGSVGRLKYVAEAALESREFVVRPVVLEAGDRISRVSGIINAVEFLLEGEVIYVEGPAGPAWRTAKVMITDLFEYMGRWR